MSIYVHFDEATARAFQTAPLQRKDINRLATVVTIIRQQHLAQDCWWHEIHKGSVTLRSGIHKDQVVKIFVDYGNRLADKCGMAIPFDDPVVVGMEISNQPAYARETLRDDLRDRFRYYADPRAPHGSKWWLKPIDAHKYDVLFLDRGVCEVPFDQRAMESLMIDLEEDISLHEHADR